METERPQGEPPSQEAALSQGDLLHEETLLLVGARPPEDAAVPEQGPEQGPVLQRAGQVAERALGFAASTVQAFGERADTPYVGIQSGVRDQLFRELHRYPRKSLGKARLLWLLTGYSGGHRYYLGHAGIGMLMTLTAGGGLIWWLLDGFRLRGLVEEFNTTQADRERSQTPPIGMEFVPKVPPEALAARPPWQPDATRGRLRAGAGLLADGLMVALSAFVLGTLTNSTDTYNPVWATLSLLFMINFADQMVRRHHWPVVRQMLRWDIKLRLFYHFNKPGRAHTLLVRPIVGLLYAPFSKKARAEVALYLEIAGLFTAVGVVYGLVTGRLFEDGTLLSVSGFSEVWLTGVVIGFVAVYAFASPIGATLMKHVLLRRPNGVRWALSATALYFLLAGLEWI